MPRVRYVGPTRVQLEAISAGAKRLLRRSQETPHFGNPFTSQLDYERIERRLEEKLKTNNHLIHNVDQGVKGKLLSEVEGWTVAIKDNIVTDELPTTCASDVLRDFTAPAPATVTKLLQDAGMTVVAKTNMDEFGMGSHSLNSAFGPVHNGYGAAALSVGGSSGGSAQAVAQNLCRVAIGTDTGGSVRLPAAYLSLVGFKPSYGRISRAGVIPYANSLDTVGIIGKRIGDIEKTYRVLSQADGRDPTCLTVEARKRITEAMKERTAMKRKCSEDIEQVKVGADVQMISFDPESELDPRAETNFLGAPMRSDPTQYSHWDESGVVQPTGYVSHAQRRRARSPNHTPYHFRIGVPLEYNIAELHPLVHRSWIAVLCHLASNGQDIVPVSLPSTKEALSAYYILATAEASSNLAKYDGVRYGAARGTDLDETEAQLYAQHRGDHFGMEAKRRILLGTYSLSAGAMDNYFIQAQKVRRLVQRNFDSVFRMRNPLHDDSEYNADGVDLIVCPTAPSPPPHLEHLQGASVLEGYMNDVFTVPASLAGLPALSVPAPAHPDRSWVPEHFVGMQVIGQYGDDDSVLKYSQHMLERLHDHERVERTVQRKNII